MVLSGRQRWCVHVLVLGARPPLELLLANGRVIVERDVVQTVDEPAVAAAAAGAAGAGAAAAAAEAAGSGRS